MGESERVPKNRFLFREQQPERVGTKQLGRTQGITRNRTSAKPSKKVPNWKLAELTPCDLQGMCPSINLHVIGLIKKEHQHSHRFRLLTIRPLSVRFQLPETVNVFVDVIRQQVEFVPFQIAAAKTPRCRGSLKSLSNSFVQVSPQ